MGLNEHNRPGIGSNHGSVSFLGAEHGLPGPGRLKFTWNMAIFGGETPKAPCTGAHGVLFARPKAWGSMSTIAQELAAMTGL